MVHFQKIPIPTLRKVIGNSEGRRVSKATIVKRYYEAKLEFLEGWDDSNRKTFCGKHMDIFWNNTKL